MISARFGRDQHQCRASASPGRHPQALKFENIDHCDLSIELASACLTSFEGR
jgi:hypothetical protein